MPRTASQPEPDSSTSQAGNGADRIGLLPHGTRNHRLYLGLSILAAVLVLACVWIWATALEAPIGFADVVLTLLAAYYIALWLARWASLRHMARPVPIAPAPGKRVGVVTSFVPGVESIAMLEQTLVHLVALEYPHETWVLDEGDSPEVKQLCARLEVTHFTRRHEPSLRTPTGRFAEATKHGNYNAWLDRAGFSRYDLVAFFDPDHVSLANYLLETIGYFEDPGIGYVQVPQVYYNQKASFIARGSAEETYRYYSSGLLAAYGLGHTVVVGSHSVHRTEALRAVGGLPSHDAEDLYLTREYQAAGWSGVFVPRILAMGLAPVDWTSYLAQQRRWARGILDLKLRPAPDPLGRRTLRSAMLNLLHGSHYLWPLSLLVLYPLLLGLLLTNTVPAVLSMRSIAGLGALAVGLLLIGRFDDRFLLDSREERGWRWRATLLQVAKAPHLVAALVDVLLNRKVRYVTTPKIEQQARPRSLAPAQLAIGGLTVAVFGVARARWGVAQMPVLAGIAAGIVVLALVLALSDYGNSPAPFQPGQFEERRGRLDPEIRNR